MLIVVAHRQDLKNLHMCLVVLNVSNGFMVAIFVKSSKGF